MKAPFSRFRRRLRLASAAACLCVCFGGATTLAQKTPTVFKTDGADSTSVSNMNYINSLESQYKSAEAGSPELAKRLRNKLIYISVEQIDEVFQGYRRKSRKRNEWVQFLLDFLEVGASSAIAITNGERAKEVIAEVLTGFKGGRSSLNKNFKLLETQILFNKMVANRSARQKEIYEKLNEDVISYPWERARSDLRTYLYAGTIDDALNSLSIETGREAGEEQRLLEETKRAANVFGAPTPAEIAASGANAGVLDAILEAYDDARTKAAKADKTITDAPKAIADAEQAIADADKKLADEMVKPEANRDQAAITAARDAKTKAAAEKKAAEDAKAKADKDKADAGKVMETNLAKLKGIFQGVMDDPMLAPLIDKVPQDPDFGPELKAQLEASIARLKAKKGTFDDYALVIPKIANTAAKNITREPTLNERFKVVLQANP